jgi:glycosyltransferase involved in cell wall biosynthesis
VLPLSVAIIARNEADRIEAAIRSVPFAAEVVVLDSGSDDATPDVARQLGARVVSTDWPGHVAQKNRALEHVQHDWVLAIDADERVSPELGRAIEAAFASLDGVVAFRVNRLSWWQGVPLRHGTWHPDWRIRLFRKDRARWAGRDPHDRIEADGSVRSLDGVLEHHPYRSLGDHLRTVGDYARIASQSLAREGRTAHWWDLAFRPPLHFVKAFLWKRGFRDGARGFIVAVLGSTYVLLKWGRLYLGIEE